jgi:hypothetical protein
MIEPCRLMLRSVDIRAGSRISGPGVLNLNTTGSGSISVTTTASVDNPLNTSTISAWPFIPCFVLRS